MLIAAAILGFVSSVVSFLAIGILLIEQPYRGTWPRRWLPFVLGLNGLLSLALGVMELQMI